MEKDPVLSGPKNRNEIWPCPMGEETWGPQISSLKSQTEESNRGRCCEKRSLGSTRGGPKYDRCDGKGETRKDKTKC
jgi:hypothetical protein